jgi:hypothetical protein
LWGVGKLLLVNAGNEKGYQAEYIQEFSHTLESFGNAYHEAM